MDRQNISSPLSVLLAGVIVIILLLASAGGQTNANVLRQNSTPTMTECIDDDSDAFYDCVDYRDNLTATAEVLEETSYPLTQTAEARDPYAAPATGTTTTTGTPGTPQTRTGTPRGSFTPTPTVTQGSTSPALTRTSDPGVSETPNVSISSATPTSTPVDAITCSPGVPVIISGVGPAHAPLLLYFGERPVGGGSVAANGQFALKLVVGQEQAGQYDVTVRVRGTSKVLRKVTCLVPSVTPTALPTRGLF